MITAIKKTQRKSSWHRTSGKTRKNPPTSCNNDQENRRVSNKTEVSNIIKIWSGLNTMPAARHGYIPKLWPTRYM